MERKLEELLSKHSDMLLAQCTAASCGGRHDWRRAHESEEAFEAAHEAFRADLRRLVMGVPRRCDHAGQD